MARQQTVMISLSVPETGQIAQQKLDIPVALIPFEQAEGLSQEPEPHGS